MYLNPAMLFVCGVMGGALASVITQPADVVKTRMQIYPTRYSGNFETFMSIIKVGKPGSVKCFFLWWTGKSSNSLGFRQAYPICTYHSEFVIKTPRTFCPNAKFVNYYFRSVQKV